MSLRIRLAHFLMRAGEFLQSLPVVVMKPGDLIEFSRQTYARPQNLEGWVEDSLVDSGLNPDELDLLAAVPVTAGSLLLLGVGGGREAIPLARMGFEVTGVDFVGGMVERAIENADRRGIKIQGLVQEISQLNVPPGAYDVVWLSRSMYSCVPTRARRVEMVKHIAQALKPGGFFLCQFHWDLRSRLTAKGRLLRRLIAACTLGNLAFEEGDILWGKIEFIHAFTSEEAVRSELEEGGLSIVSLQVNQDHLRGSAVCRKTADRAPSL